jgi:hypothetical protein
MEGSTPSEAEKEAAHGVRARKVGTPATLESFAAPLERKMHLDWLESYQRAARDERPEEAAVGEWSPWKRPSHERTSRTKPSGKKERWHTDRLFGTNSLKEGAMWRTARQ